MDNIIEFFSLLLDSEKLIAYGGLTLVLLIIFIETGLFFGFFFPGDALLFSAGLLCGTNHLDVNIFLLLLSVTLAAVLGNVIGFLSGKYFGKKSCPPLVQKFISRYASNRRQQVFYKTKQQVVCHSIIPSVAHCRNHRCNFCS